MARGDFLKAVALALFIGGVGGALAALLHLPLAWMIGSMLATTLAAVAGLPVRLPMAFRTLMVAVLGVMLGSSFSPEMLGLLGEWALSLSFLIPYIALSAAAALFVFRRLAGYDRITAYFAAMPGGLSEMILVGSAMGGDDRKISLSHAARILIVVLIVPFAFRWLYPNSLSTGFTPFSNDTALTLPDGTILIACGVIGFFLAKLARIPAAAVVGPMIASAIVHLSGWTAAHPPGELVAFAQVVMGTAVGCRFTGTKVREVLDALRNSLLGTAALLTVTLVVAGVLHNLTGLPLASLILAFSPGGLAEMSLVALSLGIDPAFVSTHHIVRICLVVILAPLVFKLLWRKR